MKPALIATDLDGTFFGAHNAPHQGNLVAARRAIEEGVVFVVATGRSRRSLDKLNELADLDPIVISSNGAAVGRLCAAEPDLIRPISPAAVLTFAQAIATELEVSYAVEYVHHRGLEPGYIAGPVAQEIYEAPLAELLTQEPILKVIARTRSADTHQFTPLAVAAAGDLLHTTFSWHDTCGTVELTAPGVTKGAALKVLLDDLGIAPDQAVAFGDMPNDVEMLELVGRGYVMAGADPALADRGFIRIGRHEDGAVGTQILELLEV